MDKLTSIKIAYEDGTYSDQIPISGLAQNIEWDSSHSLVDILGNVNISAGSIQYQINQLVNNKMNITDLNSYIANHLNADVTGWLESNVQPVGSAVALDKSLTLENTAADSKAAGDAINDLNNAINANYVTTEITDYSLAMGSINGTTGANGGVSTTRCRTVGFVHFDGVKMSVTPKEGYKVTARIYTTTATSGFVGSTAWKENLIFYDNTKYYRFCIAKSDDSAFTLNDLPDDVINITSYYATDESLTISGKAADAKATGNAIKSIEEHIAKPVETFNVSMFEKGSWSNGNKDKYRSENRARTKTFLYAAKSINIYRKYTNEEAQIFVTFYTISGEILSNISWTGSAQIPKGSIFTLIITESNSSSITERTVNELYNMFYVSIVDKDVISDYNSDQWTFSAGYISSNSNIMIDESLKMSINQYFMTDHRFVHIDCASGYTLSLIGYDDKFNIVKTAAQFGSKTGNVFVDMEGCAFFRVTVTYPNADVTEQDVINNVSISKNGSTGVGNANIISISKDGINDENKDYAPKYPKSSLVSLRKAYDQGFRDIILHVQLTSDNIPVVWHDPYINRYARNVDGSTIQSTINIIDTTLDVLNTYDFGIAFGEQYQGTKITIFEDAVNLCKNLGFKIWIEPTTTLSDSEENIVFDIMKQYGMECRMAFFSYYMSSLVRAHRKVPKSDLLFHPAGETSELEANLVANIDNLSALIDKNDVYAYVSGELTDETKMMLKNAGIKRMVQCLSNFEPTNIEGQLINNKDCNAVVTQIMPAYSINT